QFGRFPITLFVLSLLQHHPCSYYSWAVTTLYHLQRMATPASGNSTSTSGSRWEGLKESGSGFSGSNRQRTTSNRGGRGGGGGGRGGRGGGGGGLERASSSQGRAKVISVTAKATIAAELGDKPAAAVVASSRGRPGPPSRRGSRTAPSPAAAAQAPTKPSEQSTPSTAARPSNKRRRSQAGKGPKPKAGTTEEPESFDNETTGSGQPRASAVPTTAPIHDTPPHLVSPEEPARDIKNNLDALVERVRSVAIDRPITPSTSHIDWAGDDDDSLPDLDDWGITTTNTTSSSTQPSITAQAMSPIIVSLRTLPDPAKGSTPPPLPKPLESPSKLDTKPVLSSPLTQTAFVVPPTPVAESPSKGANGKATEPLVSTPKGQRTPKNRRASLNGSPKTKGSPKLKGSPKVKPGPKEKNEEEGTSIADSIHAPKPTTAKDPLFGDIGDKDGLKASMWATEPSATSAPADMPSYGDLPNGRNGDSNSLLGNRGGGRGRHRGGAFSFDARNRRGGGGENGGGGGGWGGAGRGQGGDRSNHSRNQSSPSMSPRHNRPVITGDAISRLARTIAAQPGKGAAATVES
ncbi:hypothetical protein BKA70DRAFT_1511348, partial [Coprinopsis sp. MPI-PUGE-AT-0042]